MRAYVLTLLVACIAGPSAYADILLDEFQLGASTESPLMSNDFVDTADVGQLETLRRVRILGSTTNPTGTLDIGVTSSTLTADLVTINPSQRASSGIQFWYEFDPIDLTEGGQKRGQDRNGTETGTGPVRTETGTGQKRGQVQLGQKRGQL